MAFIDPSMISDPKEQKWVVEISKMLNPQLRINIKTPNISIFEVPKDMTTKKPEAYEPRQIGLGPNHHFRPQPYKKMELKKLAVLRSVLERYKIEDFEMILFEVRKIVHVVRDCYDMYVQHDDDSLAWILAIDGLFLLALIYSYNGGMINEETELELRARKESEIYITFEENMRKLYEDPSISIESRTEMQEMAEKKLASSLKELEEPPKPQSLDITPNKRLLAQDILMAENQIPFMVLTKIDEVLHRSSSGNELSPSLFRTFSEKHSPLELCPSTQSPTSSEHLLDYMYHSIIGIPRAYSGTSNDQFPMNKSFDEPLNFVKNIPKDEIARVYQQTVSTLETFSQAKIPFPSASKLHHRSGYMFHLLPKDQGILNINFKDKDIFLPCVTLNIDSEVTLRNMVAYEASLVNLDAFPLTEYMGFMCALIVNADDAKLLRNESIIKGELGGDDVVKLFTGMSSIPNMKTKKKSNLVVKMEEVRKVYESSKTMKTYILLKKFAHWLLVALRAIGSFVEASWKIVAFIISIVTIFMLTWQAYCNAYGCDKTEVKLLPYASG